MQLGSPSGFRRQDSAVLERQHSLGAQLTAQALKVLAGARKLTQLCAPFFVSKAARQPMCGKTRPKKAQQASTNSLSFVFWVPLGLFPVRFQSNLSSFRVSRRQGAESSAWQSTARLAPARALQSASARGSRASEVSSSRPGTGRPLSGAWRCLSF